MPLYEYRKNTENPVPLDETIRKSIITGTQSVCLELIRQAKAKGSGVLLIDGWYGVDWQRLGKELLSAAAAEGMTATVISTAGLYGLDLADYRKPFVGEDPSFGWVNKEGTLADILDAADHTGILAGAHAPRRRHPGQSDHLVAFASRPGRHFRLFHPGGRPPDGGLHQRFSNVAADRSFRHPSRGRGDESGGARHHRGQHSAGILFD